MFDGYVIVDVETTGLDPDLDSILELGILIADKNFNVLAGFSQVAYFDLELQRPGIHERVVKMHTENNLWEECKKSQNSLAGIQVSAMKFLMDGGWNNQPMCGSTIQFDRSFVSAYMPKLNETFHYRHIDVSSFKNVFLKYGWPGYGEVQNRKLHRVMADCEDTLSELKSYVKAINNGFHAEVVMENHVCRPTDEFDL